MLGKLGRVVVAVMTATWMMWGSAIAATEMPFPRPPSIETNVQFWVDVFTGYGERDFVIHDRDQVWRIYQVMHLPGEGTPGRSEGDAIGEYLKVKYANILTHLATGQPPSNYEERHVADLFKGEPLSAYTLAAQNLRVQQGMRERFEEGLLRSRYYRPTMERIFRTAGLPPELVTLAEIESGFYSRAKSSAGAVGIWQFTRGTGREYMKITRYHDDRLNPTTETEAAAQLLRSNYETLGNWPLAITAYNYGTGGMANAASEYHSDYERIVQNYGGSRFGFASKNYYPEFLAALQVHQFEDQYFPNLKNEETPTPPVVKTDFAPSGRGARARHVASARRTVSARHSASHHARPAHTQHRSVARETHVRHVVRVLGHRSHLASAKSAIDS